MNTNIKIKSCTRASASAKNVYNTTRQKNQERNIYILEQNEMPPLQTVTSDEKKEIQALQKKSLNLKKD